MIKKKTGVIILAVALGIVFSKAMFSSYKDQEVMTSDGNIYLLQYASFINRDVMEENVKQLDNYFVYEEDMKYYVFLGAYTDYSNAKRVSELFESQNIFTYIKNDYLGDKNILEKVKELEKNIMEEDDTEKIFQINEEIIKIFQNM